MLDHLRFLSHWARRPFSTGALLPSSRILARSMARGLGQVGPGQVIVELGPGTGAFTRALRASFPDNRIVACERNAHFAALLRQRMPEVLTAESCASQLPEILAQCGIIPEQVGGVVSGLPLLSLPDDMVERVLGAVAAIVPPGRRYVQFTYWTRSWRQRPVLGFHLVGMQRVLRNVPPAVVLQFERVESPAPVRS